MFRYTDIKEDIAEELENLRDEGAALENVTNIFDHQEFYQHWISVGIAKENQHSGGEGDTFSTLQGSWVGNRQGWDEEWGFAQRTWSATKRFADSEIWQTKIIVWWNNPQTTEVDWR